MFGYVIANKEIMTEDQLARYKACYCGLCRALKSRRGSLSRITLSYDLAFLALVLSSMYEYEECEGAERCIMHPMKTHAWCQSEATDYAADMNLALAYLNALDDWKDDKKLLKLTAAGMMSEEYCGFAVKLAQAFPDKWISLSAYALREVPPQGIALPPNVAVANLFPISTCALHAGNDPACWRRQETMQIWRWIKPGPANPCGSIWSAPSTKRGSG